VVSPDGRYVAHVQSDADGQRLWIRQIATGSNVQIVPPGRCQYLGLTFSPDGNFVYYTRLEENQTVATLFQVPILGGPLKSVLVDVDSAVTFSPDGKRMAFMRRTDAEMSVLIANSDGSGTHAVLTRKAPAFILGLGISWSPNGKMIACIVGAFEASGHSYHVTIIPANGWPERVMPGQK
jgi:roadblock/LC7 domain-containing protein